MSDFPKPLPHGPLTKVAEGVHAVRGSFGMAPGMRIGRTMTVLESRDGLAILNAVRLDPATEAELEALGPIKHLVKLSDSHGIDEPYYADRDGVTVWSLPGAQLGALEPGKTLGPDGPIEGGQVIDYGDTQGWRESAYWVPLGGGTLITCDAIQNCCDTEGASMLGKLMTPLLGFKGGVVVPPLWRKTQKLQGDALRKTLAGLGELSFANLVAGHGPPVIGGADQQVRSAIETASA